MVVQSGRVFSSCSATAITVKFNGFPPSKFPAIQISYRLDPLETVNFVSFEATKFINGFPWDQSFNKCLMFSEAYNPEASNFPLSV